MVLAIQAHHFYFIFIFCLTLSCYFFVSDSLVNVKNSHGVALPGQDVHTVSLSYQQLVTKKPCNLPQHEGKMIAG